MPGGGIKGALELTGEQPQAYTAEPQARVREGAKVHACMPQVVAFQATMELMAQQFPGAFSGYKLEVVESHQRTKADTSGTAKAVVASFQKLGLDFSEV